MEPSLFFSSTEPLFCSELLSSENTALLLLFGLGIPIELLASTYLVV
jgi:hypothetical protein